MTFVDAKTGNGDFYYKVQAVDFSGNLGEPSKEVEVKITAIEDMNNVLLEYTLKQNYPNPFNPTTTISFSLKAAGKATISIFNTLGQELDVILDKQLNAGTFSVTFNGENLASGIYFYRLTVKDAQSGAVVFQKMNKMNLMK